MQPFFPIIAVLPGIWSGVLSVAAAMTVSFVAIVLFVSIYRFQRIVHKAEEACPDQQMSVAPTDVLRVHLARLMTASARQGSSFALSILRVNDPSVEVNVNAPVMTSIKHTVRNTDVSCVFDENSIAVIMEIEPDDAESTLTRVMNRVAADRQGIADQMFRVGIASYPGHGLSGNALIKAAQEALEQTSREQPVYQPEIVEITEEDDEESMDEAEVTDEVDEFVEEEADAADDEADDEEGSEKSWAERRKTSMLDELTGVLKPSAVSSYMQRMMNDLRHKRKKAALFCVGVNNIDHIARFHGEEAVDDVVVGVSRILQDHVRSTDLIGRHEKYAFLILSEISLEDAEIIGKRISTEIQQSEFTSGAKKIKTTVTLGVAAYPEHGRNLHLLYKAGQKVLDYNRKNDIRAYAVYDPEIHDSIPSKPMRNIKSLRA